MLINYSLHFLWTHFAALTASITTLNLLRSINLSAKSILGTFSTVLFVGYNSLAQLGCCFVNSKV